MPFKDPDASLDYALDWSRWLSDGDTITSAQWDVPEDLTKDSDEIVDGTKTVIWLSGGTHGRNHWLVCHVTTAQGRQTDKSLLIRVRSQ